MELKFTEYAWQKINYMRKKAKTEISGFGITDPDDKLLVVDFYTVKQECTITTTDMDDESISELFNDLFDEGYQPYQVSRVWIHTHPNMSATPSSTDWETFNKSFSGQYYSIMFIIANENTHTAILKYNHPELPKTQVTLGVKVIMEEEEIEKWNEELEENVTEKKFIPANVSKYPLGLQNKHFTANKYKYNIENTKKDKTNKCLNGFVNNIDIYDDYEDDDYLYESYMADLFDLKEAEEEEEIDKDILNTTEKFIK